VSHIHCRIENTTGRITLQRPEAMNALDGDMCKAMTEALFAWRDEPQVTQVLIDAEGLDAFCAGGDITKLYDSGRKGDFFPAQQFWREEYRLNALIHHYPKPYVALLNGFVMGGGVGISCHGSHRIVCETTKIAMPECGIGLSPDVGGTWLLARSPGCLGLFLGLTGFRMQAADAIHAGFADLYIPATHWPQLITVFIAEGVPDCLQRFATNPPLGRLAFWQEKIDHIFCDSDLDEIQRRCKSDTGDLASVINKAFAHHAPLSMLVLAKTLDRLGRKPSFAESLEMEYRYASRAMKHGEFLEGIRSVVIDKDRQPRWRYPDFAAVPDGLIDKLLAPTEYSEQFHNP